MSHEGMGLGLERSEMPQIIVFVQRTGTATLGTGTAAGAVDRIESYVATSRPGQFNQRIETTLVLSRPQLQLGTRGLVG
jgi:hypothetical protein